MWWCAWLIGAALALGWVTGCVVSTHEGMGGEPRVPVAPRVPISTDYPEAKAETSEAPATNGGAEQETISARHILVRYRGGMGTPSGVTRTKEQARQRAQEALARARAGESFELLVQEYSDDLASAAKGGDLGQFSQDMMVQEFGDAAFALEPGELSEVVESPYGFHVILRTE